LSEAGVHVLAAKKTEYRALISVARIVALVLIPLVDYRMSPGSLMALCYIPLLLMASDSFVCVSYGLLPLFLLFTRPGGDGFTPFWAWGSVYITPYEAFTFFQFAFLVAFALDGNLWKEPVSGSLRQRVLEVHGRAIRNVLLVGGVLVVLSMFFRNTMLPKAAGWALVLLYIRRRIPAQNQAPVSWKPRAATALLLLASVSLSLVGLEFALRHFSPQEETPPQNYIVPDPLCFFTLCPNTRGQHLVKLTPADAFPVDLSISSQGLCDREYGPKAPDEFRILMIGDSFTMGIAAPFEHRIPQTLDRLLKEEALAKPITVINGGVSGYAPWQERVFLHERGLPLDPDLVILQLFPSNDVDDTLLKVGTWLHAYHAEWHQMRLGNIYGTFWQVRLNKQLCDTYRVWDTFQHLVPREPLVVRMWNSLRFTSPCNYPELPPNEDRHFFLETELAEWYPELNEGMEMLLKDILAIREDCRARNIDFLVYSVPDSNFVNPRWWEEVTANAREKGVRYEAGKGVRIVREHLVEQGVSYIDLVPELYDCPNIDDMYYRYDGHFTAKGCHRVARILRDYLMKNYFPAKGLIGDPAADQRAMPSDSDKAGQ